MFNRNTTYYQALAKGWRKTKCSFFRETYRKKKIVIGRPSETWKVVKSARWSHGNFVINRLFPYGNFCFSELTINSQSSIFLSCLFVPSVLIYLFVHVAVVRNVCISLSCVWQSTVFVFCVNETSILYYMPRSAMYAIYEARGYSMMSYTNHISL